MSFGPRYQVTIGPMLTPMVKKLVIVCVVIFILQLLAGSEMLLVFGLTPYSFLAKFFLWQVATYIFLHGGFWHIFWNMFALWMFGCELERYWGSQEFLRFFIVTGIGAGILSVIADPLSPVPTIGASGSIYGILMAYGMMFPERLVYLYFLFSDKGEILCGHPGRHHFRFGFKRSGQHGCTCGSPWGDGRRFPLSERLAVFVGSSAELLSLENQTNAATL